MSEWIDVTDQLPMCGLPVLIKEEFVPEFVPEIQIATLNEFNGWQEQSVNHVCGGDCVCDHEVLDVIKWQLLPK